MSRPSDYAVACICPMGVELAPLRAMLDEEHPPQLAQREQNLYTLGTMAGHNVVIAVMPEIGTNAAAKVATQLLNDFPAVRFGLLVGIGGGIPNEDDDDDSDIRLGDVAVSKPTGTSGGVVQYDLGKYSTGGGFEQTGMLNKPPDFLRSAVEQLRADHRMKGSKVSSYLSDMFQKFPAMEEEYSYPGAANDNLFRADYPHQGGRTCQKCDSQQIVERIERRNNGPKFHYGTIGSANTVVKDATLRDELRRTMKLICLEMEAAGMIDSFPCLVIRGISDYADSHKNKRWQPYAAATAAAYTKELLSFIPHINVASVDPALKVMTTPKYGRGLNLFDAPEIDDDLFIGREDELGQLDELFRVDNEPLNRKVVALVGMGGVGKTQLAITYAKHRRKTYDSVFWLNAASEATLQNSFHLLAKRITATASTDTSTKSDNEHSRTLVLNWLSELENSNWLLIFDNYDDPELFDIKQQYPYVSHGSVLITTRLSDKVIGKEILVTSISDVDKCLDILRTRSGRDFTGDDVHARHLAERLGGFPLALATAGAYLRKHSLSFEEYLRAYEQHWNLDEKRPLQLQEYQDRTLHTTWNVSYARLQREDEEAAKMLKLLAYFDNKSIWYELVRAGANQDTKNSCLPQWLVDVTATPISFGNLMGRLVEYCFVEIQFATDTYSVHACVHDWTLSELNIEFDEISYWFAFDCVVATISNAGDQRNLARPNSTRLVPHAMRLMQGRFSLLDLLSDVTSSRFHGAAVIAQLFERQYRLPLAVAILERSLELEERALKPEDISTLQKIHLLGRIYNYQRRLEESEKMLAKCLIGFEEALGIDAHLTLTAIQDLATTYRSQGRLDKAEEMLNRALAGFEKTLGPNHSTTLRAVYNLGGVYVNQERLDEAERIYQRVLCAREVLGSDHGLKTGIFAGLADVYRHQGRFYDAEEMYLQTLTEEEKFYGPDHYVTLMTAGRLAQLYRMQDRLEEAERLLIRCLVGMENHFDPTNVVTSWAAETLGLVYRDQGNLDKAEETLDRALVESQKLRGLTHPMTIGSLSRLAEVYVRQGKAYKLEELARRAENWGTRVKMVVSDGPEGTPCVDVYESPS